MYNGNLFHSFEPITEYALAPFVLSLATDLSNNRLFEDLNTRPEFLYLPKSLILELPYL